MWLLWATAVFLIPLLGTGFAAIDCSGGKEYHPDPKDCTRFYYCSNGSPVHLECPSNLVFHPGSSTCEGRMQYDCQATATATPAATAPPTTTSQPSPAIDCSGGKEYHPDPKDCTRFYYCSNGSPVHLECPSNLVFHPGSSTCEGRMQYDCQATATATPAATAPPTTSQPSPAIDCSGGKEYHPDPKDCTRFYYCSNGSPVHLECPENFAFHPGSSTCEGRRQYDCQAAATATLATAAPPTTTSPPSRSIPGCMRRVCYMTNWAQYRPGNGRGTIAGMSYSGDQCTHAIYAFAVLDDNGLLKSSDWNDIPTLYRQFQGWKKYGTNLKTLLAVGGWKFGSRNFSDMVRTARGREAFANHSVTFLRTYGFDGLDLHWEYPARREGSRPADKQRFTELVKLLKETFEREAKATGKTRLLLTAAVGAGKTTIDNGYEVEKISRYLDFINLMTYDLHGYWDKKTGLGAPLFAGPNDSVSEQQQTVDWAARYWVQLGCPKEKLVVGVPFYGRSFTLKNTSNTGIGAPATAGKPGNFTREEGLLSFYEICTKIAVANKHVAHHEMYRVPYTVFDKDQWVSYEDQRSLKEKVRYIRRSGYGGVMMWTLPLDDFMGRFCHFSEAPLHQAVERSCSEDMTVHHRRWWWW